MSNSNDQEFVPEFDQASVTAAANWLHERSQIGAAMNTTNQNIQEEMIADILAEFVEFDNLQGVVSNNSTSEFNELLLSVYIIFLFITIFYFLSIF